MDCCGSKKPSCRSMSAMVVSMVLEMILEMLGFLGVLESTTTLRALNVLYTLVSYSL